MRLGVLLSLSLSLSLSFFFPCWFDHKYSFFSFSVSHTPGIPAVLTRASLSETSEWQQTVKKLDRLVEEVKREESFFVSRFPNDQQGLPSGTAALNPSLPYPSMMMHSQQQQQQQQQQQHSGPSVQFPSMRLENPGRRPSSMGAVEAQQQADLAYGYRRASLPSSFTLIPHHQFPHQLPNRSPSPSEPNHTSYHRPAPQIPKHPQPSSSAGAAGGGVGSSPSPSPSPSPSSSNSSSSGSSSYSSLTPTFKQMSLVGTVPSPPPPSLQQYASPSQQQLLSSPSSSINSTTSSSIFNHGRGGGGGGGSAIMASPTASSGSGVDSYHPFLFPSKKNLRRGSWDANLPDGGELPKKKAKVLEGMAPTSTSPSPSTSPLVPSAFTLTHRQQVNSEPNPVTQRLLPPFHLNEQQQSVSQGDVIIVNPQRQRHSLEPIFRGIDQNFFANRISSNSANDGNLNAKDMLSDQQQQQQQQHRKFSFTQPLLPELRNLDKAGSRHGIRASVTLPPISELEKIAEGSSAGGSTAAPMFPEK